MPVDARNIAIWNPFTTLSYRGISDPILAEETTLNNLGKSIISGSILITDDEIRIKEEQRDVLIQLGYDTITNAMTLTDMGAATKRAVMTLQIAANNYMVLVEDYIVQVLNLITDAKEYAFEVGRNAVELARVSAEIAEEKGAIYIQKVDLQIQLEEIERKHVEIELLRAELAAAKAQTALIMAEIAIARAELALVEANVKVAMADLEKIQIDVDIAMTLADIIVRRLTTVKYNVGVAEIAADFQMIADKLTAIEAIVAEKEVQVNYNTTSKRDILADIVSTNASDIEAQSKRVDEVNSDQAVHAHEADKVEDILGDERSQLEILTEERLNEIIARLTAVEQTEALRTWASLLIDSAYEWASKNQERKGISFYKYAHRVHPNASIVCSM